MGERILRYSFDNGKHMTGCLQALFSINMSFLKFYRSSCDPKSRKQEKNVAVCNIKFFLKMIQCYKSKLFTCICLYVKCLF